MATYPHTALFVGGATTLVVSGPHLHVLDSQTGHVLHSTAALDDATKEALLKAGPIRCVDVDAEFKHAALSGEDKKLKVWRLDGLELLSERELPKKPTEIHFTRDGQTILVSDKFGDIFSYPLHPDPSKKASAPAEAVGASKRNAIVSHENPSDGTLILGHTSLLTTFTLTDDEKYVISADRDEHIRVSWHPQGYVIERFCLGHKKFVSAVHVPKFAPSTLVSGGGDPELKLWDWMSGEHLGDIPVLQAIEPFIAVRPPKGGKRYDEDGDDDEGGAEKKGKGKGKKSKGKGKGKAKADSEAQEEEAPVAAEEAPATADVPMAETAVEEGNADQAAQKDNADGSAPAQSEEGPLVLVVRRILSADVPGQGKFLVFSAVGATALFVLPFPSDPKVPPSSISSVDLRRPVIDFSIDENGRIWALVDGEHKTPGSEGDDERAVRLLKWENGALVETASSDFPALLTALNSQCKVSATAADLKSLDIYSALASMPKNVDPEHDPMRRNELEALEAAVNPFEASRASTPQSGEAQAKARELTQREAARLKRKQALSAKLQEKQGASASPSVEPEGRETKKARSEVGAEDASAATEQGDVDMKDSA